MSVKVKFSQVFTIGEALTPSMVKLLPSIKKVTDYTLQLRTGVIGMRPGVAPLWETARPGRF